MVQLVSHPTHAMPHLHVPAVVREAGGVVVAGLDGLLLGLTVGYIALTAIGAPANYLGVPPPVAVVIVGLAITLVALAGAGLALALVAAVGWLGRRLSVGLRTRGHDTVAGIVGLPFRFVAALPAGRIGAFAVLLWVALVGRTTGPLGLLTPPGILSTFVYLAGIVGFVLAMAVAVARPRRDHAAHRVGMRRGSIAGALAIAAGVIVVGSAAFAASPGTMAGLVPFDPVFDGDVAAVARADDLSSAPPDPGEPGAFAVERLTYGSGTDVHRPGFGADADLRTPTVNAVAVLSPLDGGAGAARAAWWGFDTDALPMNGLVWAPAGPGPFPLVLIVHGNHAMGDFSEGGYAYLGEHLATRGFIAVSIDEDFLNGSWADDWEGSEQLVRAWLLLLHVDQWRTWAADPANPFHARVDLDRVALIGHSRGGEAASVAASLADASIAPRGGMEPWPTGIRIKSVVSIAPSDGQYQPGPRLDGVDFLTLQGGHDADARAWSGIRQYARTTPADDGFKAALWAYRANHGQFNTVWGRSDHGPFGGAQLNLAPLLAAAEQEDVARTAIGSFLEASLHGNDAYRGFFARPMVGRSWLPDDVYLVRSLDGATTPLTVDGPDVPVAGVTIRSEGFTATSTPLVPLRAIQPDQAARAVLVRWSAGTGDVAWGMDGLDRAVPTPDPGSTLRFALADGTRMDQGPTAPLDITVEAIADDGTTVALPLSIAGTLPPPLPVRLAKDESIMSTTGIDLHLDPPAERVLQTYAIPLRWFEALDPAFAAERLSGFRLRVARSTGGALWIADPGVGG